MSDIAVQAPRNPYKVINLRAGRGDNTVGPDWVTTLASSLLPAGAEPTDYFAPGLSDLIGMEGNTTFTVSTSAEIKPALKDILDKLQKMPLGRVASGISRISGFTSGLDSGADGESDGLSAGDRVVQSLGLPPNVRYQTELSLLPSWNGTSEVKLESLTFNFSMGMTGAWDARREVYNPVIALAAANLPTRNGAAMRGPLPTQETILGTVMTALAGAIDAGDGNDSFNIERAVSSALGRAENRALQEFYSGGWTGIWAVELGRMRLPDFYVVNTSYSFSTETDEHGFPISGKVTWSEVKSIKMAHRGLPLYRLFGPDAATTPTNTSETEES